MINKTVYLIRHAESEANAGLRTMNHAGIALSNKGRMQAKILCEFLQEKIAAPKLIILSPFARAKETAAPLIEGLARNDSRVEIREWPVQEFTYLCLTKCNNTTREERTEMREAYWKRLDPYEINGDGTESFSHLMGRVDRFLGLLQKINCSPAIVFTHSEFIRATIAKINSPYKFLDQDLMELFHKSRETLKVPNISVSKIRIKKGNVSITKPSVRHIPLEAR